MKTHSSVWTWTWTLDFDLGFVNRKYTCLQEIALYEFGGVYGARAFGAGGLVR